MAVNHFKNSISVFRNDRKTPDNNQPELRGTIELSDEIIQALIDTKSYKIDLSLWKREVKDNSPVLSGQVQLPYALRKEEVAPSQDIAQALPEEDLPF